MSTSGTKRASLSARIAIVAIAAAVAVVAATRLGAWRQDAVRRCVELGDAQAAACLIDDVPAAALETAMFNDAALPPVVLPALAAAIAGDASDPAGEYAADAARARTRRLSEMGAWTDEQGEACLRLQLVDADRFVEDAAFRARMLRYVPRAFDADATGELRDQLLYSINNMPGIDYAASEAIESGWGAIPRRSLERETPYRADSLRFPDDARGAIESSIYSFPGPFLDPANVTRFMTSVRAARPSRTLVALVDLPMRTEIEETAHAAGWTLIETHGRAFSPWPRDPFSVLARADGGVAFLVRPNRQAERVDDNDMALEVIQGAPDELDAAWGRPTWMRAPAPFHNGLILLTPDTLWITEHSVSARALERLGFEGVSVEWLSNPAQWTRYRESLLASAEELGAIYKRKARFVHDVPQWTTRDGLEDIAGGGGFDLDSMVTLLPQADGSMRALVADVRLGTDLIAQAPAAELERFASTYGLAPLAPEALRARLVSMQDSTRARGLTRFLDRVAAHLGRQLGTVERVPLFFVTVASLADASHLHHEDFQITWNNVVLETANDIRRAEGFASGLDSGDRLAAAAFARAGYSLDYLPVLPESVILQGGYRCASQHIRAPR